MEQELFKFLELDETCLISIDAGVNDFCELGTGCYSKLFHHQIQVIRTKIVVFVAIEFLEQLSHQ